MLGANTGILMLNHIRNQLFLSPHSTTNTENLLWNGKRGDFRRMSVVLAVKRCVHGEFAPEHQLSLPSVACLRDKANGEEHASCSHWSKNIREQHFNDTQKKPHFYDLWIRNTVNSDKI